MRLKSRYADTVGKSTQLVPRAIRGGAVTC